MQNGLGQLVVNGTSGNTSVNFKDLVEDGPCAIFRMFLTMNLLSTGAPTTLTVNSPVLPAPGGDDVDIILAGMWSRWIMALSSDIRTFDADMTEVRTIVAKFTKLDFLGTLVASNGVTINASNGAKKNFTVDIQIPISLRHYLYDGDICVMGSHRLRSGSLKMSGTNLSPTVTLTSGQAVAVSDVTQEVEILFGVGEAGDVGSAWSYERSTYPLIHKPSRSDLYLGGLDMTNPVASNTNVFQKAFDVDQVVGASYFGSRWRNEQIRSGGALADLTGRCTPVDWVRSEEHIERLIPRLTRPNVIKVTGPASLDFADFYLYSAEGKHIEDVARFVGNGGATHTMRLRSRSIPTGSVPDPRIAPFLVTRVRAGRAPTTGGTKSFASPGAAAANRRTVKRRSERIQAVQRQLQR